MSKKMTGKELVAFARSKKGTAYVYGTKQRTKGGTILTQANFAYLRKMYPQYVPYTDSKKIGEVCVDCSGLISWACGVQLGSTQWMNKANVKKPISSLGEAPIGALVWTHGHIGIYTGVKNGEHHYIAADGSKYGVREVPISYNRFTHWLLVEDIFDYEEGAEEVVEKDKIIVNGKEHTVNMIRKDGVTYIKTRDFAEAAGFEVSSKGKIPVLDAKK